MGNLLKLIAKLYGKSALSKTIGTRTNVIKLPTNEVKDFIKKDLNIEAASDELAQKAYNDIKELIPDIPKMNDAEKLILEGNLNRLDRRLNPPTAEVVEFGTKEKVSPEGIETLMKQKGQKAPPGTLMGNIESRVKQLEASGKELEDIAKEQGGKTIEDIMQDFSVGQKGMRELQKEGLVRATARDIITADIKAGKLKLPKELQQDVLEGGGEPIDILRNVYGEDALEVLDSLTPEFSKLRTSTEAADLAKSKFKFEPKIDRPPGSFTPEEEFATGGRVGYAKGGMTLKQLQAKAPPGEFLAYINPKEAGILKALGGAGKKINGIPSFFASSPGDTGGAGGADGAGGNDAGGGGGSGDTGDMGSEAANVASTTAGAASVGVGGIGGFGDPGVYSGTRMGNFGVNVANMARANPISSMVASAVLGPIGSLALNAARAYGAPGTTSTSETESDGGSNALVQQAIADPLGLYGARDMSQVNSMYNQYRTNVGFQEGGRVGFAVGSIPKGIKGIQKLIKAMNKKLGKGTITTADELKNPKRKLTDREIELYEEELGDSETWMSSGTLGEAEKALKDRKAYEAAMYRDYKAGRLDPQPGQKGRKQFLEKKFQEMEMTDDRRLMNPDELEELSDFNLKNEMEQFTGNRLREKYKGVLDDDLLNKMMVDDNPQRLAEVEATIDEALKMQSMGMNPQEIMSTFKKTPRTKQARGGLSYLMGM